MTMNFGKNYKEYEEYVKKNIFSTYDAEKNKNNDVFIEGPPFCSGAKGGKTNFHPGTAGQSYGKTSLMQYREMKNHDCNNTTGSDVLGFPTIEFTKLLLNLKTQEDINKYGLDNFVKYSLDTIDKYEKSWSEIYENIGRVNTFNDHYRTSDDEYINSLWWSFKKLYEENYIIKGAKVLPYSYKCKSVISNFEAKESRQQMNLNTIYIKIRALDQPENTYYLIWTTTPWSIPGNMALCVNPKYKYIKVYHKDGNVYIVEEHSINIFEKDEIIKSEFYCYGKDLENKEYQPPYNYYNDIKHKILCDDFVTQNSEKKNSKESSEDDDDNKETTGIVHVSPFFAEEDYKAIIKNKVLTSKQVLSMNPVNEDGEYKIKDELIKGRLVFEINKDIINDLRERGYLYKTKQVSKMMALCPRTHTQLLHIISEAYFVDVSREDVKQLLLELNNKTEWHPSYMKTRYEQWIKNIENWCISRNQVFAAPIPIWVSEDNDEIVISNKKDLEQYQLNIDINDIKSNLSNEMDKVIITKDNKTYKRVSYTFDCWYCSGASFFARHNYPENELKEFNNEYIGEFCLEGKEQYNKWFYTSSVLAGLLFKKPFCKHIINTGLVLAEDGTKMSKSKGNFKTPEELLEKYGSDSIRLYFLKSPMMEGENIKFNENEIIQVKQKLIQFINSVLLYQEYREYIYKTDNYGYDKDINNTESLNIFDKWIISRVEELTMNINNNLSKYKLKGNVLMILDFIEDLTNSYIKLSRDRIKGLINREEQNTSNNVLGYVINKFVKVSAPFMMYTSEYIYNNIRKYTNETATTLKYVDYPEYDKTKYNEEILKNIKIFNNVLTLSRNLRLKDKKASSLLKPVQSVKVLHNDKSFLEFISKFTFELKQELNTDNLMIEEDSKYIEYKVNINFKELSKNHKSIMKEIKNIVKNYTQEELKEGYNNKYLTYKDEKFTNEELQIIECIKYEEQKNHLISIDNNLVIDIEIVDNEELTNTYIMRQVIREIQQKRKELGLHFYDKIKIELSSKNNEIFEKRLENMKLRLKCNDIELTTEELENKLEVEDINDNHVGTITYKIIIL